MKIVFAGGKSQNRKYSKKISVDFDKKTYNTNYYAVDYVDLEFKSSTDVDDFIMLLQSNGYKEESGNKSEKYTSYNAKSNKLRLNESNYNDFSTQLAYDEYCTDCYAEGDVPLSYTEWYYNSVKSMEIDMNDIILKKSKMVDWYRKAYKQMLHNQDGTHCFYEINDKYFILLSYEKGFDESDDDGYAICTSIRLKDGQYFRDDSYCIALWESTNDAVNEINSVLHFITEYEECMAQGEPWFG